MAPRPVLLTLVAHMSSRWEHTAQPMVPSAWRAALTGASTEALPSLDLCFQTQQPHIQQATQNLKVSRMLTQVFSVSSPRASRLDV